MDLAARFCLSLLAAELETNAAAQNGEPLVHTRVPMFADDSAPRSDLKVDHGASGCTVPSGTTARSPVTGFSMTSPVVVTYSPLSSHDAARRDVAALWIPLADRYRGRINERIEP